MPTPPFPWSLHPRGVTLLTLQPVPIAAARCLVPAPLRILPVWPGTTLGGLYLVHYGPGSDLEYQELAAFGALVRHERRIYAWITHMYVDSAESLVAGREGLGVPKAMARFHHDRNGARTTVIADGRTVCTLSHDRPRWLWTQRVRAAAMHLHAERPAMGLVSLYGNEFRGRIGVVRCRAVTPVGSPLRPLELGSPVLSLCAGPGRACLGGAPWLPFRMLSLHDLTV